MKIEVQPAVKEETKKIAIGTGICSLIMIAVVFVLHLIFPNSIEFSYRTFLSAAGGTLVATLNFFLMGLSAQKVLKASDEKEAGQIMKASFKYRIIMMIAWGALAFLLPVFNGVIAIVPLLFPNIVIKGNAAVSALKGGKE